MSIYRLIELLKLEPLPHEGGYFRSTYKSEETIPRQALPQRYQQDMVFGTAIYYLLTPTDFSAMHRLSSDEIFHFYLGDPVEMLLLHSDGAGEVFVLGNDLLNGMRPQKVVPHGVWQGSRLLPNGQHGFALIGTTMAPGFDWAGFELGRREPLVEQYPAFAPLIAARTHV
jgi:hypothetical protein